MADRSAAGGLFAPRDGTAPSLDQDFVKHFAADIRQAKITPKVFVSEFGVVQAECVQDRGLDIVHVYRPLGARRSQ